MYPDAVYGLLGAKEKTLEEEDDIQFRMMADVALLNRVFFADEEG